jgi:hypothetical protein
LEHPPEGGPMKFTAEKIKEQLMSKLDRIGKSVDMIDYLGGDNALVNVKLSKLLKVPYVGCASHRLNLAVRLIADVDKDNLRLINKVTDLMKSLKSIKNISLLKRTNSPRPAIRNATRWSSTYVMLQKFLQIVPSLSAQNNYDDAVLQLLLNRG